MDCGAQINGVDVRTREQAIQMFADSRDITLLLARPASRVYFITLFRLSNQLVGQSVNVQICALESPLNRVLRRETVVNT